MNRTASLAEPASLSTNGWTPARWFLLVFAIVHLPLGIAGLLVDHSFPIGAEAARAGATGYVFGMLETNGWHSLAALLVGILAVAGVFMPGRARFVALALGLGHVGIVVQFALWDPSTFWFASNGADQVVHVSSAVGGIVSGLLTRPGLMTVKTDSLRSTARISSPG